MIEYPIFYRKFGIRRLEQVVKPVMQSVNNLFLPFNSAIQFVPENDAIYGIDADNVLLQKNKKPIMIEHIEQLAAGADKGPPRPNPFIMNSAVQRYHMKYRRARPVKDVKLADKDTRAILVVNHALYPHRYRYLETNFFTPYNKWYNNYLTLWTEVNRLAEETQRNQFILMHPPKDLPPVSLLMRAEKELTRNLMETFNNHDILALLDIWKWLGENRKDSIMNVLQPKNYDKVNLVWMEAGRWCVINLGVLNNWIDIPENEHISGNKIKPMMMQRRFLRMQMSIIEAGTVVGGEISEDISEGDVEEKKPSDEPVEAVVDSAIERDGDGDVEVTRELPELAPETDSDVSKLRIEKKQAKDVVVGAVKPTVNKKMATSHDEADLSIDETEEDIVVEQDTIDQDLEQLETLHATKEQTKNLEYKPYQPITPTLEAGVIKAADDIAKKQLISPAEHRRFVKLAERYKEIPNPYNKEQKLADLTVIKPEEVKVEEKNPITENIPGVVDKSMLSSSLKDYDTRYIKDVLPKDIVSMVLNVQKAGVAVQNYEVQKTIDLTDEYETHVIKLVPVVGSPTTIRFRAPLVREDGTFLAKGVRYRMRRQRGDLPIRKISPSEVALTSYYSKLFVTRSERAVFNYPNWLLNEITSRGIDPLDQTVTNIRMANVFDHEVDLPKVYSTIASRFSGFSAGKYDLFFDYHKRMEYFGERVVTEVESKNIKFVPIGRNGDNLLIMDWSDKIHSINMKKPTEGLKLVGDIEQLIGMDVSKRPIEIAEVDVYSKAIPIGFVLGHEIGLGNLLATIGSKVRRAGRREQYNLQDNEFVVKFQDEVLIFDRSDKMACLIFGSFNRYHKDIGRYSVYHFDSKEVYQIILENNGLGSRYTREFDMMFKLWVDHITKEILEEMKEPTDLVKLLIRACEMLTTNMHPAAVDNRYMRDKGYERIAGMMYGELSKALRVYNSKPANASATVDLNPEAVWNNLRSDPTVSVVEESNPIHSLKEKEVVVYRGAGGRSSRSMTAASRVFHRSSMGVVSEATPDNSEVGTIFYLSADPNYTSLRGTIRELDKTEGNAAKLVSTSMLLAPGAENDD